MVRPLPSWAAPAATGVGLLGLAGYVATNDPSAAGSRFPACAFHAMTGLWCPGCGLTRATHELLTGDVGAALGYNLLTPLFLGAIVGSWATWFLSTIGRRAPWHRIRPRPWMLVMMVTVLVGFSVVRNLPSTPFNALAP